MPIRITGLNSGLDTEALVSALVSAYRTKTDKYIKAQTKLTWKQEAWSTLSAKTYSFRTSLDSMRLSSSYKLKTTSVSNSTKATVTAGNDAVNGSQSLNITQLAKAGYLTGGELKRDDGKAVTGSTTLTALGYDTTGSGTSGKISLNGKEITLSGDMTVNDVVSRLKSAGVTASFDETNQRIFVSASESGSANDFSLAAMDEEGQKALKQLGLYAPSSATTALYEKYAVVQEEYDKYEADERAAGNTPLSRTDWLEKKLQDYNSAVDTVTKANEAESYLKSAANYADALDTLKKIEQDITTSRTNFSKAEELLKDSTKFVGANGDVYSLSEERDDEGRSYYVRENDATKYYLDTKEVQEQGTDDEGNPTTVTKTVTILRNGPSEAQLTQAEKDAGVSEGAEVSTVSTANDYLKEEMGVTDEQIAEYRSALSQKAGFEAAVQAEKDAYTNRVDELTKTFLDGIENPTAQEEADAKANAQQQADEELKATGEYANWRSLESLKEEIDKGSMTANDIKDAQDTITADRQTAQEFVEDHAFFASYAKQYAAAADDTSTITQRAVAEEMEKDLQFAVDALAAEKTRAVDYSEGAVRVDGQDATIYLNGAKYTSSSNTFTINGLTINALATTISEDDIKDPSKADSAAVTITTATDSQGIYDKIKDFLGNYNSLINMMTAAYNAESASEYEPLTDDEREAMTDSQIEKWEEKGKSAVLRRDSTLSSLMSVMTTAMSKSYVINGQKYSLSSFGIKTLGILNAEKNEQNAYHIDGDEDDDSVSSNSDKLMAAIIKDPDTVAEFFQLLTHDLSMQLGDKMSSTTMRTYGSFYNDKEMAKEYSDYTTTIAKWEQKLADLEETYYKKFAAMESALATLQSQASQLAGLLG